MIDKDLGGGWSLHNDGGDIELREGDQVVAIVPFDEHVLKIPAFGRLGEREIPFDHLHELFRTCQVKRL